MKKTTLLITPSSHVRSTKGDALCFRIPEKVLENKYPNLLKRKKQLERYNNYKAAIKLEAERVGFKMPLSGSWLKFYMPMPKSWSKKKKARMNFEPKMTMPDLDNLIKAFKDSLFEQDNAVWDYRASKYWYDGEKGFIEVWEL
jgi:Holliday junction resolvase RusA-like endonuclease